MMPSAGHERQDRKAHQNCVTILILVCHECFLGDNQLLLVLLEHSTS